MNFVFEDITTLVNFSNCPDVNPSGIRRFSASPIVSTMMRYHDHKYVFNNMSFTNITKQSNSDGLNKYIVATGVTHSPWDWTGPDNKNNGFNGQHPDRKNLFEFLSMQQKTDMQQGKMFLLLDQSHEGYHVDWLFDWFHNSCEMFAINPKQIIYVTGDMDVAHKYKIFCDNKGYIDRILAVPHSHFENGVQTEKINRVKLDGKKPLPTFIENYEYKKQNLSKIKLYNSLQKRPRAHRMWMFNELVKNGLLDDGINTMNTFDRNSTYYMNRHMSEEDYNNLIKYLPLVPPSDLSLDQEFKDFSSEDSGKYPFMFNEQIMLDSFVSVISEASFGEDTCFISEKTFKTFGVEHPFIIFGNRNTLKNLRVLGYQTLNPLIDESYDELDTWDRLDAIINILKKLKEKTPEERLEWYLSCKEIMEYNAKVLYNNSVLNVPQSFIEINNYFGNNNV